MYWCIGSFVAIVCEILPKIGVSFVFLIYFVLLRIKTKNEDYVLVYSFVLLFFERFFSFSLARIGLLLTFAASKRN